MLNVKDIHYGVKDRQILKGASLEVGPGEFVGLIGPNGSGKSTLLKNIYKVLKPQQGAVWLMDEDLLAMSNREMAQKLAVVIQEHETAFDFTVEEVIRMGRHARKGLLESDNAEDDALMEQVLDRTGLQPIREQSFLTLSGGEKQRVLIARALVQDTPCLILDEPTNHLDIKYQLELMELVKSLGRTMLAAIHDLNIAAQYCDRLYALKDGSIVAFGTPEALLTPELIRELYDVNAKVVHDQDGIFVRFCGTVRGEKERL